MLFVIGAYLLITVVVGIAFSGRVKSATDYLIAGRHLGLALTTASLAAVQIGAGIVMGGAEAAAGHGVWPITLNMQLFNKVHWEDSGPPVER